MNDAQCPPALSSSQLVKLRCQFCQFQFGEVHWLRDHLEKQHIQDMFRCQFSPDCGQNFLTVPELRLHLTTFHAHQTFDCAKLAKSGKVGLPRDLRLWRCGQCGDKLYCQERAAKHRDLKYECRACERYSLPSLQRLNTHINLRHGSWTVKLGPGGLVLGPKLTVRAETPPSVEKGPEAKKEKSSFHSQVESGFSCAPCGHSESTFADIEEHLRDRHNIPRDNQAAILSSIILPRREWLAVQECLLCGSAFLSKPQLLHHITNCHQGSPLLKSGAERVRTTCRICHFSSDSRVSMERHLNREHKPEIFFQDQQISPLDNISNLQTVPSKNDRSDTKKKQSNREQIVVATKKKDKDRKYMNSDSLKEKEEMKGKSYLGNFNEIKRNKKRKRLKKMEFQELFDLKNKIEKQLEDLDYQE